MPSPLSHLPFGSGLCSIFFVIFMGYAGSSSGFIPRGANKGIGPMVGKICLPLLIFRNIAKLDLSSAPFAVVGCIGVRTVTTTSKEKGRPNKTELPTTS
jgi:predicted permease